jgi:hypothetical protein
MVDQEFLSRGQEIAACGAFGAANFEEERVGLVLDLNGMEDRGVVRPGLIHQQCGPGADGNEHQESRRKQQELP